MADDGPDPHSYDVRCLTLQQWTALRRSIIMRAHDERDRAIRHMFSSTFGAIRGACRRIYFVREVRAELRAMSDYELRDIGLSRSWIETAMRRGWQRCWPVEFH